MHFGNVAQAIFVKGSHDLFPTPYKREDKGTLTTIFSNIKPIAGFLWREAFRGEAQQSPPLCLTPQSCAGGGALRGPSQVGI